MITSKFFQSFMSPLRDGRNYFQDFNFLENLYLSPDSFLAVRHKSLKDAKALCAIFQHKITTPQIRAVSSKQVQHEIPKL